MKRAFVIVLVLLAAWTFEPIRARTYTPAYGFLVPIAHRLVEPSKEGAARQKGRHLLRLLVVEMNQGRSLPEPRDFEAWARRQLNDRDAARDPWGSVYWYERVGSRITVGSPGPDMRRGTPDDILVSAQP